MGRSGRASDISVAPHAVRWRGCGEISLPLLRMAPRGVPRMGLGRRAGFPRVEGAMRWWHAARCRMLSMIATDCPLCGGLSAGGRPCAACWTMWSRPCIPSSRRVPALRPATAFGADALLRLRASALGAEPRGGRLRLRVLGDLLIARVQGGTALCAGGAAGGLDPAGAGPCRVGPIARRACRRTPCWCLSTSSRASLRRRGFNPAAELARALGQRMGRPVQARWLARGREGPKQSGLTRQGRLRIAAGAFVCPRPVPACTIGLVDDVMTTGSTLQAAALALARGGGGHDHRAGRGTGPGRRGRRAGTQYRLP